MTVDDHSLEESSPLLGINNNSRKKWQSESDLHLLIPSLKDEKPEKLSTIGKRPKFAKWKRYLGIFLAIIASVFLSLTTLIAKLLAQYHPFNEALWRFTGILIPSIPVLLYFKYRSEDNLTEAIWPLSDRAKLKTFFVLFVSF